MSKDDEHTLIADALPLDAYTMKQVEALKHAPWLPKKSIQHQHDQQPSVIGFPNDKDPQNKEAKLDAMRLTAAKQLQSLRTRAKTSDAIRMIDEALAQVALADSPFEIESLIKMAGQEVYSENQSAMAPAPQSFEEYQKEFQQTWNQIEQLEEHTRKTMEKATDAGYISPKDEDKSKKEQEKIEKDKAELDKHYAEIRKMSEGPEKDKARQEYLAEAQKLAEEIVQHANHDKGLIQQAIEAARRDNNYALAKDLEEALPKKDQEVALATKLIDTKVSYLTKKYSSEKNDAHEFASTPVKTYAAANSTNIPIEPPKPTDLSPNPVKPITSAVPTDLPVEPPKPTDLPAEPPKPTDLPAEPPKPSFAASDVHNDALGSLSPLSPNTTAKSTGKSNGVA